jgi:hypothetical protein
MLVPVVAFILVLAAVCIRDRGAVSTPAPAVACTQGLAAVCILVLGAVYIRDRAEEFIQGRAIPTTRGRTEAPGAPALQGPKDKIGPSKTVLNEGPCGALRLILTSARGEPLGSIYVTRTAAVH